MGTKIKTFLGACALLTAVGTASATTANAAGPPVERFDGIYLECDQLGEVFIVSIPGNGTWTPGPVLDTNTILVPYKFHFESSFTPTGGTPQTEIEEFEKRAPKQATLDRCTGTGEFSDDTGTFEINIVAWVAVR